jgi:hypothetical protein
VRDWREESEGKLAIALEIATFALLFLLIIVSFWASNWRVTAELDVVVLALISYTLLLVLPISDFDLSLTGLKAKMRKRLNKLSDETDIQSISAKTVRDVDQEVIEFADLSSDADLVFMSLIIQIQKTLDEIASSVGIPTRKSSLGDLIQKLRNKGILAETWLLQSLYFLRDYRNEVLHLGKISDIQKAIGIEKVVLADLRNIQDRTKCEK